MSTVLKSKRWLVRNVRRLVGNEQVMLALHSQAELIASRLAANVPPDGSAGDDRASGGAANDAAPPGGIIRIGVNGDLLEFPVDLLPYIIHTKVSGPEDEIPLFLAETPHYCWIRDRLHVGAPVLDVGANLGLFSVMMARQVKYGLTGRVYAFEPSPRSRQDLSRLLACNHIANVAVCPEAVSDRCGKAVFHDIGTDNVTREASHLSGCGCEQFTSALPQNRIEVDTIDLDTFVERYTIYPQLIKIDVEFAEFLVLEGARRCIERHRPLLVIEVHPGESGEFDSERLHRYLDEYRYHYHRQGKIYYCE
jgi:FkbM family methyltransferase